MTLIDTTVAIKRNPVPGLDINSDLVLKINMDADAILDTLIWIRIRLYYDLAIYPDPDLNNYMDPGLLSSRRTQHTQGQLPPWNLY